MADSPINPLNGDDALDRIEREDREKRVVNINNPAVKQKWRDEYDEEQRELRRTQGWRLKKPLDRRTIDVCVAWGVGSIICYVISRLPSKDPRLDTLGVWIAVGMAAFAVLWLLLGIGCTNREADEEAKAQLTRDDPFSPPWPPPAPVVQSPAPVQPPVPTEDPAITALRAERDALIQEAHAAGREENVTEAQVQHIVAHYAKKGVPS